MLSFHNGSEKLLLLSMLYNDGIDVPSFEELNELFVTFELFEFGKDVDLANVV